VRVRIRPLPLAAFCIFSLVLATFSDLAGFMSTFFSVILPTLLTVSLVQLFLSRSRFMFHQSFSNDHPLKGEVVHFSLAMENDSRFPAAEGRCLFADPGPGTSFPEETPTPVRPGETLLHEAQIRCAYRGTYAIGLTSILFRDATGIATLEEKTEPRLFYVYPEIISLDVGVERLARSSGSDRPGSDAREQDPTIFEYVAPVMPGRPARRIAWKRWAATGIPAENIPGQARSSALRIILDLWPNDGDATEKLACEDMAMSAVFSVLRHLARERIPVELVYGSDRSGITVSSEEQFAEVFDRSTNVIFNDGAFPEAAFSPNETALLVTTRPLIYSSGNANADLFTLYEEALPRGTAPHLLVCPPPSRVETEKKAVESLADIKATLGAAGLLALADSRRGLEDIAHALRL
jgi:uncharacterized protein (DUF58 family)